MNPSGEPIGSKPLPPPSDAAVDEVPVGAPPAGRIELVTDTRHRLTIAIRPSRRPEKLWPAVPMLGMTLFLTYGAVWVAALGGILIMTLPWAVCLAMWYAALRPAMTRQELSFVGDEATLTTQNPLAKHVRTGHVSRGTMVTRQAAYRVGAKSPGSGGVQVYHLSIFGGDKQPRFGTAVSGYHRRFAAGVSPKEHEWLMLKLLSYWQSL